MFEAAVWPGVRCRNVIPSRNTRYFVQTLSKVLSAGGMGFLGSPIHRVLQWEDVDAWWLLNLL